MYVSAAPLPTPISLQSNAIPTISLPIDDVAQPVKSVTVLHCGGIIDGLGNVEKNQYILIEDGRIHSIGCDDGSKWYQDQFSGISYFVHKIDLQDSYVLPGLIDCHVHPCILDVKYAIHPDISNIYKFLNGCSFFLGCLALF